MRHPQQSEAESIRRAFDSAIASDDPYGEPFRAELSHRLLVFPTEGAVLTQAQFGALARAARGLGDEELFVLSLSPRPSGPDWIIERDVSVVAFDEVDAYRDTLNGFAPFHNVENAIVPPSGSWAVVCSDEAHAVAAGPERFISEFVDGIGLSQEMMALAFLDRWKRLGEHGLPTDWIAAHLTHLYGQQRAEHLMREAFPLLLRDRE